MAFWAFVTGLAMVALFYFSWRGLRDGEVEREPEEADEPQLDACPRCGRKTAALEYHRRHCLGRPNPAMSPVVRRYELTRRSTAR